MMREAVPVALGIAGGFAFGIVSPFILNETSMGGLLVLYLAVGYTSAAVLGVTIRDAERKDVVSIALRGAFAGGAILLAAVLGSFIAAATDASELYEYGGDLDWQSALVFNIIVFTSSGIVIGALTALTAHFVRFGVTRR